jgi:hypothetical protein
MGCGATKPSNPLLGERTPSKAVGTNMFEHTHEVKVKWGTQARTFIATVQGTSSVGTNLKVILSTVNTSTPAFAMFVSRPPGTLAGPLSIGSVCGVESEGDFVWKISVNGKVIADEDALVKNCLVSPHDEILLSLESKNPYAQMKSGFLIFLVVSDLGFYVP